MRGAIKAGACLSLLLVAACDGREESAIENLANGANEAQVDNAVRAEAMSLMEPLDPPQPGTPGGLPVAPPPASEGEIDPESAQGAAQIVQSYYGLLEAGRFSAAQDLWNPATAIGAQDDAHFEARFRGFSEVHANIGAPGDAEGAAGSTYVSVPVQVYGRIKATGSPFHMLRRVTLRRVNQVPGSTQDQRRWHIERIGTYAAPDMPDADSSAAISATDGLANKS